MKRLYSVTLYNFAGNQYETVLLTIRDNENDTHAESVALACYGNNWRIHSSAFVCNTPDDVHTIAR